MIKDKNMNMICYSIIFLLLINLGLQMYSLYKNKKDDKEGYEKLKCANNYCDSHCERNGYNSGSCIENVCTCS